MKRTLYPVAILAALAVAGCGTRTPLQSSARNEASETRYTTVPGRRILYPAGATEAQKAVAEGTQQQKPAAPPPKAPVDRPAITFSSVESANVRVPGVNPLPPGGLQLVLPELLDGFCYPYRGKMISPYGMRSGRPHTGMDIKAVPGDTIRAAFAGVVRMSKGYSGYGNLVVVYHWLGFETLYAHNVRNLVAVNEAVEAGQPIALAGRTGRATTEHLHFEMRVAGEPINPDKLLDYTNMTLRPDQLTVTSEGGKIIAFNHPVGDPEFSERALAEARTQAATPATPAAVPAGQAYHTVAKGDTLSGIARANGTSVRALCTLNGIDAGAILRLGQKIKVR